MKRRRFLQLSGLSAAGAPFWWGTLPESMCQAIPSGIKITDLQTIIVESEVYLKLFTNVGVVGEGHTTVHRKVPTCEAAVKDLGRVLIGRDPT